MVKMLSNGEVRLTGAEQVTLLMKCKKKTWFSYIVNVQNIENLQLAKRLLEFESKHQIKFYVNKYEEIKFKPMRLKK